MAMRTPPRRSEISAYVDATGKWETIAIIPPTSDHTAEAISTFIAHSINDIHEHGELLVSAMNALDDILREGLTFSTEQTADRIVDRIKKVYS